MLLNIRNGDCGEIEWNLLLTRTLDLNKNIINVGEYKRYHSQMKKLSMIITKHVCLLMLLLLK